MSNVINLEKWKQSSNKTKNLSSENYTDDKKEQLDIARINRIKESLKRINALMAEIKKGRDYD